MTLEFIRETTISLYDEKYNLDEQLPLNNNPPLFTVQHRPQTTTSLPLAPCNRTSPLTSHSPKSQKSHKGLYPF